MCEYCLCSLSNPRHCLLIDAGVVSRPCPTGMDGIHLRESAHAKHSQLSRKDTAERLLIGVPLRQNEDELLSRGEPCRPRIGSKIGRKVRVESIQEPFGLGVDFAHEDGRGNDDQVGEPDVFQDGAQVVLCDADI